MTNEILGLLERLDASDEQGVLGLATESVVRLLGHWGAAILLEPQTRLVLTTDSPAHREWPIDLAKHPEIVSALESGSVVTRPETDDDPWSRATGHSLPPGATTVVPLLAGRRRLGALVVRSRRFSGISPEERTTALAIGRMVGLLLAAARSSPPARLDVDFRPTPVAGVPLVEGACGRILVVEDDIAQARALEGVLREEGYEVVVVARGEEALVEVRKIPPDLVLMDVCLPGLDGVDVATELARDRRTSSIPVLLVSAADDLTARVRGCRRGEMDFLPKPYRMPELLARIDRCLREAAVTRGLRRKAHLDELTGLGNLRLFEERLVVEMSRVERYRTPLTLVMIDVDGLKIINDRHGHTSGSAALKAIGHAIKGEVRDTDLAVRYGGDEFVILLPHTSLPDAVMFCDRLLDRIRQLRPRGLPVSVSVGLASRQEGEEVTGRHLLERADRAAYQAKRLGGNRVCVSAAEAPGPDSIGVGEGNTPAVVAAGARG